jgi:hypothetical protein
MQSGVYERQDPIQKEIETPTSQADNWRRPRNSRSRTRSNGNTTPPTNCPALNKTQNCTSFPTLSKNASNVFSCSPSPSYPYSQFPQNQLFTFPSLRCITLLNAHRATSGDKAVAKEFPATAGTRIQRYQTQ